MGQAADALGSAVPGLRGQGLVRVHVNAHLLPQVRASLKGHQLSPCCVTAALLLLLPPQEPSVSESVSWGA